MLVCLLHSHDRQCFENISYWQGPGKGAVWVRGHSGDWWDHLQGWCDGFGLHFLSSFNNEVMSSTPAPPVLPPHALHTDAHCQSSKISSQACFKLHRKERKGKLGTQERQGITHHSWGPTLTRAADGTVASERNLMSSSCLWFGGQDGSPIPMRMEHQRSTVAGRPAVVYGEEGGLPGSPDGQKRKVMERVPSGSGRAQRRESPPWSKPAWESGWRQLYSLPHTYALWDANNNSWTRGKNENDLISIMWDHSRPKAEAPATLVLHL